MNLYTMDTNITDLIMKLGLGLKYGFKIEIPDL